MLKESQKELDAERAKNENSDQEKIYEELNKRYLIIISDIKGRSKMKNMEY